MNGEQTIEETVSVSLSKYVTGGRGDACGKQHVNALSHDNV
jgi:hypothetical protein